MVACHYVETEYSFSARCYAGQFFSAFLHSHYFASELIFSASIVLSVLFPVRRVSQGKYIHLSFGKTYHYE